MLSSFSLSPSQPSPPLSHPALLTTSSDQLQTQEQTFCLNTGTLKRHTGITTLVSILYCQKKNISYYITNIE